MNNKLNVLLTGASGTVGLEVLKQLYRQRHRFNITVFDIKSKNTLKTFAFCKKNIEIVYGDISNNYDIRKACFDKDYVIHLAAIIPPLADENPSYAFKVNTLGTENLIKNLEQLSPLAFLLYSSSISVYGDRLENPLINVEDPFNPSEGDEYAKTKIKAEYIIYSCNLDWSIFRLTAIMGNHKLSKLMFHMPLDTSLEIATPEDTARAFVHAIDDRFLISKKIFNLGGGYGCRTTYKEFLIRSFKILGLGDLDFPQKAFADKNFHCGFYEDSDELEKILHFRKDSIEDYFDNLIRTNPFWKKILTSIFKKQIKKELLKNSEPFLAFNTIDTKLINHFFKI
jgi:cholest-5-ene-3beta,7alpha-diol 3beta-dehydrogenase